MITEKMLKETPAQDGYVWATPYGQWITYTENRTHTGTHKRLGVTDNINQAYVGQKLPESNESGADVPDVIHLVRIPAITKTVRVVQLTNK